MPPPVMAKPTEPSVPAVPADAVVRELLRHSGRGDTEAFARLYDVVIPVVLAVSHLLAGPDRAEAVAERACVDVWRWSPGYARSSATPLAWITARVEQAARRDLLA